MSKDSHDNISYNTCFVILNLKLPGYRCKILVKFVYSFKGKSFYYLQYNINCIL